ncbi:MAG: hypothetical protein ACRDHZ_24660, partial [Ktedonobacteraceae bacterium]
MIMRALLDYGVCNIHIIILPDKHAQHAMDIPLRSHQEEQDVFWFFLQGLLSQGADDFSARDIRMVKVTLPQKGTFHEPA